jgi:hypothetical protein
MTHQKPSEWKSEEIWRSALSGALERMQTYEGQTYYNRQGQLDEAYTAKLHDEARRRFERIFATGQAEWRQRYGLEKS